MRWITLFLILVYTILISLYFIYRKPLVVFNIKSIFWTPMTIIIFTIATIISYFTILQIMIYKINYFIYFSIFIVPISYFIKYLLTWQWPFIGILSCIIFSILSFIFINKFSKEINIVKNIIISTAKIMKKFSLSFFLLFIIYFIIQFQCIVLFNNYKLIHKIDYTFFLFIIGLINCLLCHFTFHLIINELLKPNFFNKNITNSIFNKIDTSILLSSFLTILSLINIILFEKISNFKPFNKFILNILIRCTSIFLMMSTDLIFIYNFNYDFKTSILKTIKCYNNHITLLFYIHTLKRILSLISTPFFNFLYNILINQKLVSSYRNTISCYINPQNIHFDYPVFVVSDYFSMPFLAIFIILLKEDELKNIKINNFPINCKVFIEIKKQIKYQRDVNHQVGYIDIFIMKVLSLQNMSFLHK